MNHSYEIKGKDWLWVAISGITHPIWFPLLFFFIPAFPDIELSPGQNISQSVLTMILVPLFPAVVGLYYFSKGSEAKKMNLDQKSRLPLYALLAFGSFFAAFLWKTDLQDLYIIWGLLSILCLVSNTFSRISFHTAGITCFALSIFLLEPSPFTSILFYLSILALIGGFIARYKLKAHSIMQLIMGMAIAFLTIGIYLFLKKVFYLL